MNLVISGALLACAAVLVMPAAARLVHDPADPTARAWRLALPVAGAVGMVSLLLPAGGVALGLAVFYVLWVARATVGALVQARSTGGPPTWAHACAHLVLWGGTLVLAFERSGRQPAEAGWVWAAVAVAHLGVALTDVAIAWDRLGESGSWWLLGHPAAAALVLAGWAFGLAPVATVGALTLLGLTAVTGLRALRAGHHHGPTATGRDGARVGTVLVPVGVLGVLLAGLLPHPAGLWTAQAGLALTAAALVVAARGWVLLLAPVASACAATGVRAEVDPRLR